MSADLMRQIADLYMQRLTLLELAGQQFIPDLEAQLADIETNTQQAWETIRAERARRG